MIGKKLSDRYEILELIGRGGMANVYKAHDNRLGRDVAIKILKKEFADDEEFIDNFRKESHSAAKLNHNNIVGVYDVGMDIVDGEKQYYIVMELVDGETLKDKIEEKGHLSVNETIYYAIKISEALLNAHENGIIHRDIKPQNILIKAGMTPVVTDFGIAQAASKATITTNSDILGSVHYFSPEQAKGEKTDVRSDIYSLGIVMFEMLTGRLPFNGENPISIALKQVQEKMPKPSSIMEGIPDDLDRIILKMTEKNPHDRYSDLNQVLFDLKAIDSKTNLETSDTLVIPIENISRKIDKKTVGEQRRIRRAGIENSETNRKTVDNNRGNDKGKGFISIILGIILALIVATGVFLLVTKIFTGSSDKADTISAPDLIGVNIEEARKIVEDAGLELEIVDRLVNHSYDLDDVIDQQPSSGTKVKLGSTIRVTINIVEGNIEVKKYIGENYEDIEYSLEGDGLKLGPTKYEEVEDEEEIGLILEQDLRPGTMVEKDSIISFTVGKEIEIETVEMPNLKGVNIEEAKKLLDDLGLSYSITEQEREDFDENDVIEQGIKSGDEVEVGTSVGLVIAKKPVIEEPEPIVEEPTIDRDTEDDNETVDNQEDRTTVSYSISVDLPESEQYQNIRVVKVEGSKSTVEYESLHLSEEGTIVINVTGDSKAIYQVFVDDVLFKTEP